MNDLWWCYSMDIVSIIVPRWQLFFEVKPFFAESFQYVWLCHSVLNKLFLFISLRAFFFLWFENVCFAAHGTHDNNHLPMAYVCVCVCLTIFSFTKSYGCIVAVLHHSPMRTNNYFIQYNASSGTCADAWETWNFWCTINLKFNIKLLNKYKLMV